MELYHIKCYSLIALEAIALYDPNNESIDGSELQPLTTLCFASSIGKSGVNVLTRKLSNREDGGHNRKASQNFNPQHRYAPH